MLALKMAAKITLKDIARETGFTVATVSRALSGKDKISQQTRVAIRMTAKRLGYRPDPALSRLAAWRWGGEPPDADGVTLAWVTDCPDKGRSWYSRLRMEGIRNHAKLLGYNVATFNLRDLNYKPKRLASVLRARGIRGVLIERVFVPGSYDGFPWDEFCPVNCGLGFQRLPIPTVTSDLFEAIRMLWAIARERGYRKIGVVNNYRSKSDIYYRVLSAVRLEQSEDEMREGETAVPPLLSECLAEGLNTLSAYEQWNQKYEPDAILLTFQLWRQIVNEGLSLPPGFACFDWNGTGPGSIVRACQSLQSAGELAVELCHLDLQLPAWHGIRNPTLLQILPTFEDGETLPLR